MDPPQDSILGPLVLQDTIPLIKPAIGHLPNGKTHLEMSYMDASPLFSAAVRPRADSTLVPTVLASVAESAVIIEGGVSSYGPPLHPGQLTKIDLNEEDVSDEPRP